jgi:RNA polymerase sigma factor for flagellar operon FliA
MTKGPESSSYTARQRRCVSLAKLPAVNASGSTEERERFLIEHVPVVRFIARRIHVRLPQHILIEDLYSAGLMGLLDAASKFVPSRHVQFRNYAQFRIRGAIIDSLRDSDWGSRRLRRKGRDIEHASQTLTAQFGRVPVDREVAQQLNIGLAAYQRLLCELKGLEVGWLYSPELAVLPGRPERDPLSLFLNAELRERLADAISRLAERERRVLTLYYYEELKQREISSILGVKEARISQILSSAVLHLRAQLTVLGPFS